MADFQKESEMMEIALVSGESRYENVARALSLIEVDELKKAKRVLVKPNFTAMKRNEANTHKDALKAVLDFLRKMDKRNVTVGDGSGDAYYLGGTTEEAFRRAGVDELCREYEVELRDFNQGEYAELMEVKTNFGNVRIRVVKDFFLYDYVISLTLPKTHDYALATLSMKNMMGVIHPADRLKVHGVRAVVDALLYDRCVRLINVNLFEFFKKVKPNLSVIDGFCGMEGEGPVNGDVVECGWALASTNPLLADVVGVKLMGLEPREVGYIHYMLEEQKCEIPDDVLKKIEKLKRKFRLHPRWREQKGWE
ncbi:MAG: DUF362 domain-containing protein [Candidatus Micrarchaeia archaeon]